MVIFQIFVGNIMEAISQSTSIGGKRHQWTSIDDSKLVEYLVEITNNRKWEADDSTFNLGYL